MAIDVFSLSERLMRMDDAAWARHSNPLSVWSRFSVMPLLTLAIASRVWLGWGCLLPITLVLIWTYLNPRLFGPPQNTDSWASKGTFGERLFLARHTLTIPAHHLRWAKSLTLISALGLLPWTWGLWTLDLWPILLGLTLTMGAKAWFVDRMVWLYEDVEKG